MHGFNDITKQKMSRLTTTNALKTEKYINMNRGIPSCHVHIFNDDIIL